METNRIPSVCKSLTGTDGTNYNRIHGLTDQQEAYNVRFLYNLVMTTTHRMFLRSVLTAGALIICLQMPAQGDPYDPPSGYYATATGTGATLKSQLHNIIDGHTVHSYDAARSILQITDADPDNADHIILVYDRASVDLSNIGGSIPGWDNAATWNREHTWPRSRGVGTSGPDNSDLHQLRPSDTRINSDRGSLDFGGTYGTSSYGTVNDQGSTVWYPGDADAGMIARQEFYMAVRYDGSDSATDDLELSGGTSGGGQLGDLSRMMQWHYAAPPDTFERIRNQRVSSYQNNRNPFVDRPEYAWSVFMDQANDSRIAIQGATVGADGSSVRNYDLGSVFVGSTLDTQRVVTLDKSGLDGTYFEVTTSGDATSSIQGRNHAFRTGQTDAATIMVGLDGSTASPGVLNGTVVIDNLDVTTNGGAGRGANDADDLVQLSLTVLNHASASFLDNAIDKQLSYDFGSIVQGSVASPHAFHIVNLADPDTTSLTANLDIDRITSTGDVSALVTTLSPTNVTNAVLPGEQRAFIAAVDTSNTGTFSATYTIDVSDQDLPGAKSDTLTITLMADILSANPGDYDLDGDVDLDDYTTWKSTFNSTTLLNADGNGNGIIDAGDFVIWRDQAMELATPESTYQAVPEPTGPLARLFAVIVFYALVNPRRRRRSHGAA